MQFFGSQVTPTPVPPGKTPTTVRVTIQPRQVKGAGEKVSYSGVYVCSAQASVTLTIKADGSAELYAAGLGFADYLSCRSSGSLATRARWCGSASPLGMVPEGYSAVVKMLPT